VIKLAVMVLLASFLITSSESSIARWLLEDVLTLIPSIGLNQYLYHACYLWEDFATAVFIASLPYTITLISLGVLLNRYLKQYQ